MFNFTYHVIQITSDKFTFKVTVQLLSFTDNHFNKNKNLTHPISIFTCSFYVF